MIRKAIQTLTCIEFSELDEKDQNQIKNSDEAEGLGQKSYLNFYIENSLEDNQYIFLKVLYLLGYKGEVLILINW